MRLFMGKKVKGFTGKLLSFTLAITLGGGVLLGSSLQVKAAASYSVADGDITIEVNDAGEYSVTQGSNTDTDVSDPITITGTSTRSENKNETKGSVVKIDVAAGQKAKVILSDVEINAGATGGSNYPQQAGDAALYTCGAGDVEITLLGSNTLISGVLRAGLEKENTGELTITGTNKQTDKLTATGGRYAAGIGTGCYTGSSDATQITISGGYITATTVDGCGAGIGGGSGKSASDICIEGSQTEVKASSTYGAAIGGGSGGNGSGITISGGTVTASSTEGAGIGAGSRSVGSMPDGSEITISGGTVTASSELGAGIGGGGRAGEGKKITISNGTVIASSKQGAGIGGGDGGAGSEITISGGAVKATSESGGAGIGGGTTGNGSTITISGGIVIASSDLYGAGIGGGCSYHDNFLTKITKAENITISGDAYVQATGGRAHANHPNKTAPAIGGGLDENGSTDSDSEEYGKACEPNTSGLTTGGLRMQVRNVSGAIIASETSTTGTVPANLEERFNDLDGASCSGNGSGSSSGGSSGSGSSTETSEQKQHAAFVRKLLDYEKQLQTAADGSTVKLEGDENFNSLPASIIRAFMKNGKVNLEFTYSYKGKPYTIVIPAGTQVEDGIDWYGPMYLWGHFGNSASTTKEAPQLRDEEREVLYKVFDAELYASLYADVVAGYGTEKASLFEHFVTFGMKEGRKMCN